MKQMTKYNLVAESLNKKGILPFSAREWNCQNVQAIYYYNRKNKGKRMKCPEVMAEFKLIEDAESRQV